MILGIVQALIYLAFTVTFIIWIVRSIKDIDEHKKDIDAIQEYIDAIQEQNQVLWKLYKLTKDK